jgi:hypothetical protein
MAKTKVMVIDEQPFFRSGVKQDNSKENGLRHLLKAIRKICSGV